MGVWVCGSVAVRAWGGRGPGRVCVCGCVCPFILTTLRFFSKIKINYVLILWRKIERDSCVSQWLRACGRGHVGGVRVCVFVWGVGVWVSVFLSVFICNYFVC